MAKHVSSIQIKASPEVVFEYLTEPEHITKWVGGLISTEPLTDPGLHIGAKSRETVKEGKRTRVMESEVLAFDRPRSLDIRITSKGIDVLSKYTLNESGSQTFIQHDIDAIYSGILRLISFMFKRAVQRQCDDDLVRLKTAVENRSD